MTERELWLFHECHEAVTRLGIEQPCDKKAVALRIDPEAGHPYPVCAQHARESFRYSRGSLMVPLADVVQPVVQERDRIAAERDTARAELTEREADLQAALARAERTRTFLAEYAEGHGHAGDDCHIGDSPECMAVAVLALLDAPAAAVGEHAKGDGAG